MTHNTNYLKIKIKIKKTLFKVDMFENNKTQAEYAFDRQDVNKTMIKITK